MKIAIIGFGLIGQQRAQDILKMKKYNISIICDTNPSNLEKAKMKYGCATDASWQSIIKNREIDVIIVAVPHNLAPQIVISALEAGKHVLCEKPMGRNILEAKKISDAVIKSGKMFEPGFNYRFYPGIKKIHDLISDNAIGKVTHARCVLGHGGRQGMENEWKTNKEACGGGVLIDPGIHAIDLFSFLFGDIKEGLLIKNNSFWDIEVEDNAFVFLKTIKNVSICAHFSITEWKSLFRLEIFGTNGYIILEGRSKSYGPQKLKFGKRWFWMQSSAENKIEYANEENSFYEELSAFLEQIETGKKNEYLAGCKDGHLAINVIDRLYENTSNKHFNVL